jgi:hypothetical protein
MQTSGQGTGNLNVTAFYLMLYLCRLFYRSWTREQTREQNLRLRLWFSCLRKLNSSSRETSKKTILMKLATVLNMSFIVSKLQCSSMVRQNTYNYKGSIGEKFYIILSGTVSVQVPIKKKKVNPDERPPSNMGTT